MSFFKKHYNLRYYRAQSNNFVIFDDFFIYNRNEEIRKPFRFMIKSFENKKQEDLMNDLENKKRKENKVPKEKQYEPSIIPTEKKRPVQE